MKLLYPFAKRFIAGHDFESAKPKIRKLMDDGYEVSIDYVGELSKTIEDCFEARRQYLEIINYYKDATLYSPFHGTGEQLQKFALKAREEKYEGKLPKRVSIELMVDKIPKV